MGNSGTKLTKIKERVREKKTSPQHKNKESVCPSARVLDSKHETGPSCSLSFHLSPFWKVTWKSSPEVAAVPPQEAGRTHPASHYSVDFIVCLFFSLSPKLSEGIFFFLEKAQTSPPHLLSLGLTPGEVLMEPRGKPPGPWKNPADRWTNPQTFRALRPHKSTQRSYIKYPPGQPPLLVSSPPFLPFSLWLRVEDIDSGTNLLFLTRFLTL